MELAAQLEARGAELELNWAPRTHNQEADDLTNQKFEAFDPKHRVTVDDLGLLPWLILPRFMDQGARFYTEMTEAKAKKRDLLPLSRAPTTKRAKDTRLKVREPW